MRLSLVAGVCAAAFLYTTSAAALTERDINGGGGAMSHIQSPSFGSAEVAFTRSVSARHRSPRSLWRAFLCIHHYEGAWTDSGAPYYGGLQFDAQFERTYGPEFTRMWGHANNWPPAVQMSVAMRAYETRGFRPWPATARRCGLL